MNLGKEKIALKRRLNWLLVILILGVFTISGYHTKQDINDLAYVVAIRC